MTYSNQASSVINEIGAARLIDNAKVKKASTLVSRGEVFSLAQPLSSKTPMPAARAPLQHFMSRDGGDYFAGAPRPGGFQFADDSVVMPLHSGTHIDALCHCWYGNKLYNGFSSERVTSRGALRCGIEKLPPLVSRGILLDVVALVDRPLADGDEIGPDLLKAALERAETRLERGDVVLIRTGWLETVFRGRPYDFNTEPGINVASADWLARGGVSAVGSDNFAIEAMPFAPGKVFPVHQLLIRDFGITLLEGLVLDKLAKAGASTFLFVAAPLPIVGATGSPLTPLAIL